MALRPLLNVAYAHLSEGRSQDQLRELDGLLEDEPRARRGPDANVRALLAAGRMPQAGAGQRGKRHGKGRRAP